jgi:hypothetical protein
MDQFENGLNISSHRPGKEWAFYHNYKIGRFGVSVDTMNRIINDLELDNIDPKSARVYMDKLDPEWADVYVKMVVQKKRKVKNRKVGGELTKIEELRLKELNVKLNTPHGTNSELKEFDRLMKKKYGHGYNLGNV